MPDRTNLLDTRDNRLIKEQGYVYVKEEDGIVRLKHKEDDPHLLTANKLRRFDAQTQPRQGAKRKWNDIHLWRSTVSGDTAEEEQIGDLFDNGANDT